jgi:hypothetical protein
MKKIALLGLVILMVSGAFAQEVTLVSTINGLSFNTINYDIVVDGSLAYIGSDDFCIADISTDIAVQVAILDMPEGGSADGIAVAEGYAYIAARGDGLRIIDVSTPSNPVEVGFVETQYSMYKVEVEGDYAYVAAKEDGLRVFNVSDPSNPVEVGVMIVNTRDLELVWPYVYLGLDGGGFSVVDISDPANPTQAGFLSFPGRVYDLDVNGDYIYVASDEYGLRIINISDPLNPIQMNHLQYPGGDCQGVTVSGSSAFVTFGLLGMFVFDITNPVYPVPLYTNDTYTLNATRLAIEGDRAYILGTGLRVVDISILANPSEVNHYPWNDAEDIALKDDVLFVSERGGSCLRAFSVRDPSLPVEVGIYGFFNTQVSDIVATDDDFVYCANSYDGLHILDVSDLTSIVETGSVSAQDAVRSVDVEGDIACVTDGQAGLSVIDVSNPTIPVMIGWHSTPYRAQDVYVIDTTAYVAVQNNGLYVYSISDPTSPLELGAIGEDGDLVYVHGDYAYLGANWDGVRIYDVSDPSNLSQVGFAGAEYPRAIFVDGDLLFVGDDEELLIYDVSDPTDAVFVGSYTTLLTIFDITVRGDLAYAVESRYVQILDISELRQQPLMTLTLDADLSLIVPAGGSFEYDAHLVSNLPSAYRVDLWSNAILPNGNPYGPIWRVNNVWMGPDTEINMPAIQQSVPLTAPLGSYTFRVRAGNYPGTVIASDEFPLEVVAAGMMSGGATDWTAWGYREAFGISEDASGDESGTLPRVYSVSDAYPNPFNPTTTIAMDLPEAAQLAVTVYNINGQQVAQLAQGLYVAGTHRFTFDASTLTSGLYFIHATVPGQFNEVRKVTLMK